MLFLLSTMVVKRLQSRLSKSFEVVDNNEIGLYDPGSIGLVALQSLSLLSASNLEESIANG